MGASFPFDSHPVVYFITWEMHGCSHQFPIAQKNPTKPIYGEDLGNWYSYFSHSMGASFPLDSHYMVLFITWEMYGFSNQFTIAWEISA